MTSPSALEHLAASPLWDAAAGGTVVIACSGGRDSTALVCAVRQLLADRQFSRQWQHPPRVLIWHAHHGLRPENDDHARFVDALGARLGIPVVVDRLELEVRLQAEPKLNMEQAAREVRYQRLHALLADPPSGMELPQPRLALTAHHLGDQAETVLYNLVRGTHLKGLRGIAECYQGRIWRPWLRLSPEVLAKWVAEQGFEYVTDSTNSDLALSRNKLRHEVLPRLMEINPRAREHISRLGLAASTAHRYLERSLAELEVETYAEGAIDRWLPLMAWPPGDYIAHYNRAGWDDPELLAIYAGRELEELLGSLSAEEHIELARWALEDDAPVTVRGWQVALPNRTVLTLASPPEAAGATPELTLKEGCALPVGGLSAGLYTTTQQGWQQFQARRRASWEYIRSWGPELAEMVADPPEQPSWYCYLPPGVPEPLRLRAWQPGDSITLSGGGSKKLGDIFTDAKLPQCFRPVWAVLTDARGEVLWVPGLADSATMQFADGVEPARLVLLKESR